MHHQAAAPGRLQQYLVLLGSRCTWCIIVNIAAGWSKLVGEGHRDRVMMTISALVPAWV